MHIDPQPSCVRHQPEGDEDAGVLDQTDMQDNPKRKSGSDFHADDWERFTAAIDVVEKCSVPLQNANWKHRPGHRRCNRKELSCLFDGSLWSRTFVFSLC